MSNTELSTVRDCIESDSTLKEEWMKLSDSEKRAIGKEVKHMAVLQYRYVSKKNEYLKEWLEKEILPRLLEC